MNPVYVESIGLTTPGMNTWEEGIRVLTGKQDFLAEELARYKPKLLPTNERRRATEMIRLAFKVCEEATQNNERQRQKLASVFSSSGGDYQVLDQIAKALALPEKIVSPTQFHNSVHNSASGYWGIAAGSCAPSISISAHDSSFFAGLLEAVVQVSQTGEPVLFAAYDSVPPEPLIQKRRIGVPFASAYVLKPENPKTVLAKLNVRLISNTNSETQIHSPLLEQLRRENPAAKALSMLNLIANKKNGKAVINGTGSQAMAIEVESC